MINGRRINHHKVSLSVPFKPGDPNEYYLLDNLVQIEKTSEIVIRLQGERGDSLGDDQEVLVKT